MFKRIIPLYLIMMYIISNGTSLVAQKMITIPVSGACGMCKDRIETTSLKVIGVNTATYNIEKQLLTVEVQPIFVKKELVDALLSVGHDTDGLKADNKTYEALHECCHYRDINKPEHSTQSEPEHSEDDGHDHSEGDGHDHSEGDGHDHSEG